MKQRLQYYSAFIAVIAGIILCYVAYFLERLINDSVLWFFAQCLLYAASIFGVSMIILNRNKNEMDK